MEILAEQADRRLLYSPNGSTHYHVYQAILQRVPDDEAFEAPPDILALASPDLRAKMVSNAAIIEDDELATRLSLRDLVRRHVIETEVRFSLSPLLPMVKENDAFSFTMGGWWWWHTPHPPTHRSSPRCKRRLRPCLTSSTSCAGPLRAI
jgi:hypothetical protein